VPIPSCLWKHHFLFASNLNLYILVNVENLSTISPDIIADMNYSCYLCFTLEPMHVSSDIK